MTRSVNIETGGGPERPWNTAWGAVGPPVTSTTFSQAVTSATLVDLTGLTMTFTPVLGRRYRVTAFGLVVVQTVATGSVKSFLTDGSNNILGLACDVILASGGVAASRSQVNGIWLGLGLAAASTTVKLRAQTSAGTATFSNDSGAQVLLVTEDIGPAW